MNTNFQTTLAAPARVWVFLLTVGLLAAPVFRAAADLLYWTNACGIGGVGGNMTWTNAANWTNTAQANAVPTPGDEVRFGLEGATNDIGLVNSIVDADLTVLNVFFNPTNPYFHTILINPGKTLTVLDTVDTTSQDKFGLRTGGTLDTNSMSYVTVKGPGGTVVVGDTNSPTIGDGMRIHMNSTNLSPTVLGPYMATLDLSALDNFSFALGSLRVGANAASAAHGTLILAKTNLLIVSKTDNATASGFVMGQGTLTTVGNLNSVGHVKLGQKNVIWARNTRVGSARGVGSLMFQTGLLANPTVFLRKEDGVNAANAIYIGDNDLSPSVNAATYSGTSTGRVDLVGGTVDVLVEALLAGRNSRSTTRGGSGHGTIVWSAGTIAVTDNTDIGRQGGDNVGTSTGVVNVLTNAVLQTGRIRIGSDAVGAGTGTGNGTLNIAYGGQVTVTNDLSEDIAGGSSTINITNGTLTVGGVITVDALNYSGGTVLANGTLGLTSLKAVTAFTLQPGQRLAPVAVGAPGTLAVNGSLILSNAILCYDLSTNAASRDLLTVSNQLTLAGTNAIEVNLLSSVTNGTYIVATSSSLVGNAGNLKVTGPWAGSRLNLTPGISSANVTLQVSGAPGTPLSLTWAGDGSANVWDLNNTLNWNSHAQKFYNADVVTFDNSGSASPAINLVGTLSPASVTVNASSAYTFSGSGKISGSSGLTKLGSGILTVANGNDYTGATVVSNGTLAVNGQLGNTAVTVIGGATLTGAGTILGSVTVQNLGTFHPGASPGTLILGGSLVLNSGSTTVVGVNPTTSACDAVSLGGGVTYGGALVVSNLTATPLAGGNNFQLFNAASYSGSFAMVNPPTPGPGLLWDLAGLTNGTLRVVAPVSLAAADLTSQMNGNLLQLSWPVDHTGWQLECQTNNLDTGLSTNWSPMPGSTNSNQFSFPVDPNQPAVFYRLTYSPTMKELRREIANRQRRIIYNNDGGEPKTEMTEPTAENLLLQHTTGLENGSQVDSIFYCPHSAGFGLFTYFTTIGAIFTSTGAHYSNSLMSELIAANIDPLRVMVDFGRQNGIEIFCSFRMNDTHDGSTAEYGPVLFNANPLKVNHPEYLLGSPTSDPPYGAWTAVNYARPEIRDLALRYAEEVCTNFDVDGIELDFFRHPVFFPSAAAGSSATATELNMMTDLMRQIRAMADQVGQQRGRPILIAMRVPDDVNYCKAIGLDLQTWLADDLLDILSVSSYYKIHDWDYSVGLGHMYGVKVYPSLDECRLDDPTALAMRTTDLAYRGRAANVWGYGADGVYIFNFNGESASNPLWWQMGSTQTLASLDKDYFGTIRGRENAAGGNLPYSSYQTIEILNPDNPKTIAPGATVTGRINVGEDLNQAGTVNLKLRLLFSTTVSSSLLQITCNGQPLTLSGTNLKWVEYTLPASAVRQVVNEIRVTLSASAPASISWTDLHIELRH